MKHSRALFLLLISAATASAQTAAPNVTFWYEAEFLKWDFTIDGNTNLVVYFMNRVYSLLSKSGSMALIASQSIKEGTSRADGMERFLSRGAIIGFARTNLRWPGKASTTVDLVALHKSNRMVPPLLNERHVSVINSYLQEGEYESQPLALTDLKK